MAYSYVVTNLAGRKLGEVDGAYNQSPAFQLNAADTLSFRVRPEHKLADTLLSGDCVVMAYERLADGSVHLRQNYDVADCEEVGEGLPTDGVSVALVDGSTRLGGPDQPGRLAGKSSVGYLSTQDRGQSIYDLVTAANADADTGIRVGAFVASTTGTMGPWYYKPVGEALAEMSALLDGFDWRMAPLDPATNAGKFWELQIVPTLGTAKPWIAFEYGCGKHNIKSYKRAVDRRGVVTKAYALPPGFPPQPGDTAPQVVVTNTLNASAAITARGLREYAVPNDLVDPGLRTSLANAHVQVRQVPRQVITFESVVPDGSRRVPVFKQDFDIGDVVTGRAVNPKTGSVRFNGAFRVYGVSLARTNEGTPVPTMTLIGQQ